MRLLRYRRPGKSTAIYGTYSLDALWRDLSRWGMVELDDRTRRFRGRRRRAVPHSQISPIRALNSRAKEHGFAVRTELTHDEWIHCYLVPQRTSERLRIW